MSTEKSAGFISGGRIKVFDPLIFIKKESFFLSGRVIVRGGGRLSRLTTTGFLTAIVAGDFNEFFFSKAYACFGLF
jgi:hypothetical protein